MCHLPYTFNTRGATALLKGGRSGHGGPQTTQASLSKSLRKQTTQLHDGSYQANRP